jgi:replicative DNA helicase
MTTFSTHMSPDEALGRILDQADLIETLAARSGPGAAERAGRIRVAAGVIKDHARLLFGDDARGLLLEDGESARRAVMHDPKDG